MKISSFLSGKGESLEKLFTVYFPENVRGISACDKVRGNKNFP